MQEQSIPIGLCQCGCGGKTNTPRQSCSKWGYVKGVPVRYMTGHNRRGREKANQYVEEDRGYSTPCWTWQLFIHPNGYGAKGNTYAHIHMYKKIRGAIPPGLQLDHLCRVRNCVNPDHLEPVTGAMNAQRGAGTKLTAEKVACIRERAAAGEKRKVLAAEYGVAYETICCVIWRTSWK